MLQVGNIQVAVGETVILLHPPLPAAGVSTEKTRECQQLDSLADGNIQGPLAAAESRSHFGAVGKPTIPILLQIVLEARFLPTRSGTRVF